MAENYPFPATGERMNTRMDERISFRSMMPRVAAGLVVASVLFGGCSTTDRSVAYDHSAPTAEDSIALASNRLLTNRNEQPAGRLHNDTLDLQLEVRPGRWYPESDDGQHETVLSFAERGKAGRVPGPFVRVRKGTLVRVALHNPLPHDTLYVHGFAPVRSSSTNTNASAPDAKSITNDTSSVQLKISPGATIDAVYNARNAGTYFYWASTNGSNIETRRGIDSQLHGAIVVDSSARPARDRVFVLGIWGVPVDTLGPKPWVPRDMMTINGKSWPHTERFDYTIGDTVRWRWINPSIDGHPMHLHGFYFDVTATGTDVADTSYTIADRRSVVTELMLPGTTMSMQFVPNVAGNWLFHCHFTFHVSHYLSFALVPDDPDAGGPSTHPHEMRGLALGISVHDSTRASGSAVATSPDNRNSAPNIRPTRQLRLMAERDTTRYGKQEGFVYVTGDSLPRTLPKLSSTIELERGEPVAINVINHLRQPTAVHWHGIELRDSYVDGVPRWSGSAQKLAPPIAARDSFVATFTPPRSGTFIYHSHNNEEHQIGWGLYGALIVRDSGVVRDTVPEHLIVIGSDGPNIQRSLINGELKPAPLPVDSNRTYRLRIVQINPEMRVFISLKNGSKIGSWTPVAKDGADLPPSQKRTTNARLQMGPGETIDVEVHANTLKNSLLEVSSLTGSSRTTVAFTTRSVSKAVRKSQ